MAEQMGGQTGPMDGHLDEEQLFGLAEGGLDASARASAEAHLRGCAGCRRELEIAAGYFKRLADLEPVQAPANFLANVRARLPRPSPLRAFMDVFMRPLRVIPMQLALLTILGLTAISSYLYQRGGWDGPSQVATSGTAPSEEGKRENSAAESDAAFADRTEQKESPAPGAPPASPIARAPGEYPRGPVDMSSSGHASRDAAKILSKSAPKPSADAQRYAVGRGAAAGMDKKDASPRLEEELAASETVNAGPAPASAASGSARPSAAKPQRAANAAADEKRGSAYKESEEPSETRTIAARKIYGSGEVSARMKNKAADTGAGAGDIRPAEIPAFIVTLAPGKRIAEVVSGLKAMGADSLSAWASKGDGVTSQGMDYLFRVPASMRKELAPYLERYGRVQGAGPHPAAGTDPARIRIRFLP